jgi:hypothetical protein
MGVGQTAGLGNMLFVQCRFPVVQLFGDIAGRLQLWAGKLRILQERCKLVQQNCKLLQDAARQENCTAGKLPCRKTALLESCTAGKLHCRKSMLPKTPVCPKPH